MSSTILPNNKSVAVSMIRVDAFTSEDANWSLSPAEQQEFAGMTHPRRRAEWLAVRIALKQLAVSHGLARDHAKVEIRKDPRGRPELWPAGTADCSLSHKGDYVLAALTTVKGLRIGVDIEPVSPRVTALREKFVRPGDFLSGMEDKPDLRHTLLWCIKEAASKCLGRGLPTLLEGLTCRETRPGSCTVRNCAGEIVAEALHEVRENYTLSLAWRV